MPRKDVNLPPSIRMIKGGRIGRALVKEPSCTPTNAIERAYYEKLIAHNWRPRTTASETRMRIHTCYTCGLQIFRHKTTAIRLTGPNVSTLAEVYVCSTKCYETAKALVTERRKILLALTYAIHAQRVREVLKHTNYTPRPLHKRLWGRGRLAAFVCDHPTNTKITVCASSVYPKWYRADLHFPPVPTEAPLQINFLCRRAQRRPRLDDYKYFTPGKCKCPACTALTELVDYKRVGQLAKPTDRSVRVAWAFTGDVLVAHKENKDAKEDAKDAEEVRQEDAPLLTEV